MFDDSLSKIVPFMR